MISKDTQAPPIYFEVVAELGRLLGLNKSSSLALAFIFATDRPLSLDEITDQTGIAKSSNSVILKNLQQMGLIETVAMPQTRRKFYKAVENPADVLAALIAQQFESVTRHQQALQALHETDYSTTFKSRFNQLNTIQYVFLQMAGLLRAGRADAWEDISNRLALEETLQPEQEDES